MMKALKCSLALLLTLALLIPFALAEGGDEAAVENGIVTVIADSSVLAEPSPGAEALADVLEGDRLVYLYEGIEEGFKPFWFFVSCGDISGWISVEFAKYAGDDICYLTALDDVKRIEGVGGDSNIRVEPNREAEIIGLLKQGETVVYAGASYVDSRTVRWDFVEFENRDGDSVNGWISSMYTEPKAPEGGN